MRHLFQLIVAYSMSLMNEDFDRAYAAIRLLDAFETEVRERIPGFGLPHSLSEPKKLYSAAPFEKELVEIPKGGIKRSFGPTLDLTVRENDQLMFMSSGVFSASEVYELFIFGPVRLSVPEAARQPPRMMRRSEFKREFRYEGNGSVKFTIYDLAKRAVRLRRRTERYYR